MLLAFFLLFAASISFEDSFRAGLAALQHNDLSAAVLNLETASKLAPANGRVWVALSQSYRRLGETAKGDDAARRAVKLAPTDPVVLDALELSYFDAAQPMLREQKFGDAVNLLEPAAKLLPGSAQIQLALGVAYYGLRRFDEAAGAFLRTIAISPATEQPYAFLGKFLDQIPDRWPEALRRFEAFEQTKPFSALGYLLHAKVLNAQGLDAPEARQLLEKSISLDGKDASAHFELASLCDRLGEFGEAATEFEKSAALDPTDSAAHYRLARDYDRLGRHEEAQAERERHAALVRSEGGMH